MGIEINPLRLGREHPGLIWAASTQVLVTSLLAGAAAAGLGINPPAAALLGLSVALSSSVVVVNITRSRRRTTNRATDEAMLGWSVLQDITGVALALLLLAVFGFSSYPPLIAAGAIVAYVLLASAAAWALPMLLRRLSQVGEFSFVLASIVVSRALIPAQLHTGVLAAVVVTIVLSTTLVRLGGRRRLETAGQQAG